jgi:hypothetical protein
VFIATEGGQPWSEVGAMSPAVRRAFIYALALQNGASVDWNTGGIRRPRRRSPQEDDE